jgi:CMP-N,N'-diacetyllegionaminic acid synthase
MEKFTILCPWLRPSNLSKASTTSYETVLHAISWYERVYEKLDMIILLQPTSPYRNKFTLKRALCLYEKYPQYNIKTIKKDISQTGRKKILINSKTFQPNGNFYIFPRENLNSEKLYLNKNKYIFVKDKKENIDIDTINDFENANKLL